MNTLKDMIYFIRKNKNSNVLNQYEIYKLSERIFANHFKMSKNNDDVLELGAILEV